MKRRESGIPAPFLDLAFTLVVIFLSIVMISTVSDPKPKDGLVIPKAEFLIALDWTDGSDDDIDLYVRGPDDRVVYFSNRSTPSMFLDQDNLGTNNTVTSPSGEVIQVPSRREIVTIRKSMAGDYIVNAHFYRKKSEAGSMNKLRLTVTKLNPFKVVTVVDETMTEQGEERTLVNFTLDEGGAVKRLFVAPERLVR